MKAVFKRILPALLSLILLASSLSGCGARPPAAIDGTAPDDILTFQPNTDNKPIVRIGTQYYSPDETLVKLLQEEYPEYLFVLDYASAAGTSSETRLIQTLENGSAYYDLVIIGDTAGSALTNTDIFYDLSAESFLDDYLLSALNNVSVDGHIYTIPGTSTLTGIAFNADMFAEHGWDIPETVDEFFDLCAEIKTAGIEPFSACFKYDGAITRLLTMMNYSELFKTEAGLKWVQDIQAGNACFKGHYEPVYDIAKRLYDGGILTVDSFSASLTAQRKDFWAGKYAMIDYDSAIYTYAEVEGCDFELGIMPYPSRTLGGAGFAINPEYYLSIPSAVAEDPERLALMLDILTFISSAEGQEAILAGSLRISNVRGIDLSKNEAAKYAEEAYERGNLYPQVSLNVPSPSSMPVVQQAVKTIFEGATVDEAIAYTDELTAEARASVSPASPYEKIAEAEDDLTMLETSYYIADQFRELTGADMGLVINGGFFRSNLASIDAGDITGDMRRFVMKGVGAEDWLTTYELTGAQLKKLLEYPIVNGSDVDAMLAVSGLKLEYAPWNQRGSRVVSATLEDGGEIEDDALYTVAAWAGVIDEQYITNTLQAFDTLGPITDIMLSSLTADSLIKPNIADRVTLSWPEVK